MVGLNLNKKSKLFQISDNLFSGFIAVKTGVFSTIFINGGVRVHDIDHFKVMPETYLKVIGVMGRSYLNHTGAEFPLNIIVGNDGYLTVHQRQCYGFPYEILIALILRVDCHRSIPQHGLGTRCGYLQICISTGYGVLDMPEAAFLFLIFHLGVRYGGTATGTPVDNPFTPINQVFFVEPYKNLQHSAGQALIHGKALPLPVAGTSQLLKLLHNTPAVLFLPLPGSFQEFLAAYIFLGKPLFSHLFNNLYLGSNAGMIRAGKPQGIIPLHPPKPYENILQGIVQGVPHMELTCNIRWGYHNTEGLLFPVNLGVKIVLLHPSVINLLLYL